MMPRYLLATALALSLCVPALAAAVDVQVMGAVTAPGVKHLPAHARLSDAALASPLRADAYALGASWQRPSLLVDQTRLKAGLLFDLDSAHQQALRNDLPALADATASLREWIAPMPVTGRAVALLDPRAVEINAVENKPVGEGDTLLYPTRPDGIRVVGAVEHACDLPLVPLKDARDYLDRCAQSSAAEHDWIFVIQPDGRWVKQGVGAWNSGHAMPLAPGAIIVVPLHESGLHAVSPDLNQELAAFLATQPLRTEQR